MFQGRDGKPLTGWSKRLRPVYEATAAVRMAPWTPHDLRRTMRTGLSTLAVDPDASVSRRIAAQAQGDLLVLERVVNEQTGKLYTVIRVDDVRRILVPPRIALAIDERGVPEHLVQIARLEHQVDE